MEPQEQSPPVKIRGKYGWAQMEIGKWYLVLRGNGAHGVDSAQNRARTAAHNYATNHGLKAKTQSSPDGTLHVMFTREG